MKDGLRVATDLYRQGILKYLFFSLGLAGVNVLMFARADAPDLPGDGFSASRYESLWTKSPFAVASPDGAAPETADYSLVGIARIDGVSYASLVEKQSQIHFLVSDNMPARGLTLVSVTRGTEDGLGTFALIKKDDQLMTLKLDIASNPATANLAAVPPGVTVTQSASGAPVALFHRRAITVPPPQ